MFCYLLFNIFYVIKFKLYFINIFCKYITRQNKK